MRDDGGSAFPEVFTDTKGERGDYRQETYSAGGMTLRDYFAAKVVQGIYAAEQSGYQDAATEKRAAHAYAMADAMLKARSE